MIKHNMFSLLPKRAHISDSDVQFHPSNNEDTSHTKVFRTFEGTFVLFSPFNNRYVACMEIYLDMIAASSFLLPPY